MIIPFNTKKLSYHLNGSGDPVLLLHGFLENKRMWSPLEQRLGKTRTLVVPDLPGHGQSSTFFETHSMEFMADAVHHLLEQLELEEVDIVGHSMGGYVALAFLERYPNRVKKILLLNSTPFADSAERRNNRERALKLIPRNKSLFIPMAITNLFAEENRERYSGEIEKLIREALAMPVKGIVAAIRGMRDRKDRSMVLKDFEGQKLFMAGISDPVVPVSEARKACEVTRSRLLEVEGGHMTLIENVKEIDKIVHFIE